MQPDNLYNQLRFNLEQPYDINKLSVRHKKPCPVTIERGGAVTAPPLTQEDADRQLAAQFNTVSLDRLKEAQFLAQRQLKKQKDEELMSSMNPGKKSVKPKSPAKAAPQKFINKKPVKVTPTKKLQHMPAAGNSPPVRDVSNYKHIKATSARRNLTGPLGETHRIRGVKSQKTTTENKGIIKEILDEDNISQSMPDLHRMAMDQLLRIQSGEITPPPGVADRQPQHVSPVRRGPRLTQRNKQSPKRGTNRPRLYPSQSVRPRSSSPPKFMSPSQRSAAAAVRREQIYTQSLTKPGSRSVPALDRNSQRKILPHNRQGQTQVLRRHPRSPQYDPDYSYVDPEALLHDKEAQLVQSPQVERSRDLPNADEFIQRITEARRENEMVERYTSNPKRLIDQIEREARQRLEPLIEQAQRLSQNMKSTAASSRQRRIYTMGPQYSGWNDNHEMSGDELLFHPVEPQGADYPRIETYEADAGPSSTNVQQILSPEAIPSTSQGDIHQPEQDGPCGPSHGGSELEVSPGEMKELKLMLDRLDQMQKEHVEIRNRWMTASQQHVGSDMVTLDGADGDAILGSPRPMLLTKSRSSGGARAKKASSSKPSLRAPVRPTSSVPLGTDYRDTVISLPEKKINSTEEGKQRFRKHLDSICHTPSMGFDPWTFADQTADDILNHCITQVAQELLNTGDDLIQGLYADEFIPVAANHSNTSIISATPS